MMSVRASLADRWRHFRFRVVRDPALPSGGFRRHWRSTLALSLALAGIVAFNAWLATCGFKSCPSGTEIRAFRPPEGGRLMDRNGRMIGRLALVRRINVPLDSVPEHVREAFIATEDRRFYDHDGLDWRAVARAVARNVSSLGVREGFSTITMQVARNTFIARRPPGERSLSRKLIELRMSRLLERHLSKNEILSLYLNAIYLGNGVYGVEAASRDLFGKRVAQLTVAEGAMLAALPKGPSAYTPRRDHARALARRNLVIALMQREGYLDRREAIAAAAQRLRVASEEWRPRQPNDSYAFDAVRALVDSVTRALGERESEVTVYTTIDLTAQRAAERAVRRHAARIQRESEGWEGEGRGALEGALVALDPRTGDVRALVGGRRYEKGSFNRAISARRQPGSAFKPFVYATALAAGFSPASTVDDEPITVEQGGTVWTPANYGDEYRGRVTLRTALMQSSNSAAVRVSRSVGESQVAATARRNGIVSPLQAVPAIALGALEVTPLELTAAYAPFANGGWRVQPRLVRRIVRADGSVMWQSAVRREPAMDPRDAWQLTSMLRSVVDNGTGRGARAAGVTGPVAGKTGTTNNGADVWFVGYTPTLVAGVWFGYDTPRSLGYAANGGRFAAPAWGEFYAQGWRERSAADAWRPPGGLVAREIDAETGDLAGEWCPLKRREWFKPGSEPTSTCTEHEEPLEDVDAWVDGLDSHISAKVAGILKRILKM